MYKNENFFAKPNLLNSYWAGFIAADGNISKRTNSNTYTRLYIGLGIKDLNHLRLFRKQISPKTKIYKRKMNDGTRKYHDMCEVVITSKKLVIDLKNNFNITPKKSLTLKFPKNLTKKQIKAFLIGYIDGDGCIGKYKSPTQSRFYTRLMILGTKDFIRFKTNKCS